MALRPNLLVTVYTNTLYIVHTATPSNIAINGLHVGTLLCQDQGDSDGRPVYRHAAAGGKLPRRHQTQELQSSLDKLWRGGGLRLRPLQRPRSEVWWC